MEIKIITSTCCHEDYHSPEQYGEWRTSYSTDIIGYSKDIKKHKYQESCFVKDDATKVFAVFIEYSSGNSFGSSSGEFTIIDAFSDEATAAEFVRGLYKAIDYKKKYEDRYYTYVNDLGIKTNFSYCEYTGYFEHIDRIAYEEVGEL